MVCGALILPTPKTTQVEPMTLVAFDDGDLNVRETSYWCRYAASGGPGPAALILPMADTDPGLVSNVTGPEMTKAMGYTTTPQGQVVGVLLGLSPTPSLFGSELIYHEHHLRPGAWPAPKPARPSRQATANASASQQDRLGMHTFRSGDHVEWMAGKPGEHAEAVVWGVMHRASEGSAQARKALILYEQSSSTFFIGGWPSWRRISKEEVPDFDADDNSHVKRFTGEEWKAMAASWKTATELAFITTATKLEREAAKEKPPPAIQAARDAEASRAEQRTEKQAQQKAKVAAAKKRREAAAAAEGEDSEEVDEVVVVEEPPPPRPSRRRADKRPRDGDGLKPSPPKLPSPPKPPHRVPEEPSPSPPGSVRQLKKLIRGLRAAQVIPGQEPPALAARAQELAGYECDLEDRERKYRKTGRW